MTTSTIYEPTNSGSLFVAAIFGDNGLLVASYSFPTRAGAEGFVAACSVSEVELPGGSKPPLRDTYDEEIAV